MFVKGAISCFGVDKNYSVVIPSRFTSCFFFPKMKIIFELAS